MTDLLLKIGLSNACFSLALAVVAVAVGKTARRPHLANLLWLLVLVKLSPPRLLRFRPFRFRDRALPQRLRQGMTGNRSPTIRRAILGAGQLHRPG